MREWIEDGKTNGLFNPGSNIHVYVLMRLHSYFNLPDSSHLFHWLWSKIVQKSLDEFKDYWNYHKSRNNNKKHLPSGVPPLQIFRNPEEYGLARLSIPVEVEVVEVLRENLAYSRDEAFRWVPEEFDVVASQIYEKLRCPKLEPSRGWTIFGQMSPLIEDLYM